MIRQQQLPNGRRRAGEIAGNVTADCAAVCCCVPCAVMDMVALAAYKVPACLWKKAVKKKRKKRLVNQQRKNKKNEAALLNHNKPDGPGPGPETVMVGPTLEEHLAKEEVPGHVKLEEEMWARFSASGFWRSDSKRQEPELQTGEKDR
ncbi:uncharacterized protein LOC131653492 [Vicia villosa]|uniref:uncharacterized protein LOC131653492 n=1 Tax=Vicia villosa TaxID=3911 RepID=UPI00273BC0A7|nr:uncharacterized protein LOC131653492 [Vicia villosa]